MAKMFCTIEEASQKLSVSTDQIHQFVAENRLREFRGDGSKVMFKVDQVDRLANELKSGTATGAVIAKGDTGLGMPPPKDTVSLSETDATRPASAKEDTVVTGKSVSVFDTHEVKSSDTSSQTQIQSSDEGLSPSSLEGVGSGSGLLDLTRESDDTSLGAELLDEIYPGGDAKKDAGIGSGSGLFQQVDNAEVQSGPSGLDSLAAPTGTAPVSMSPVIVEAADPAAGAFGGLAIAAVLVMLLTATIAGAAFQNFSPAWVNSLVDNIMIFAAAIVVITGLFAIIGFFAGKAGAR